MSVVTLASLERRELERLARSRTRALERVKRRAKVILMLSAGGSYSKISKRLGCTVTYISYWRGRFRDKRLIGLDSRDFGDGRRRNSDQIEVSKIHRDVVSRGVFVPVRGLERKLIRYIRKYKNGSTPIRWIY